MRKCCVIGCDNKNKTIHCFPKDVQSAEVWMKIIFPDDWQKMMDTKIYSKIKVCHAHFSEAFHLPGSRRGLTVGAIPTIGIPSPDDSSSEKIGEVHVEAINNVGAGTPEGPVLSSFDKIGEVHVEKSFSAAIHNVEAGTSKDAGSEMFGAVVMRGGVSAAKQNCVEASIFKGRKKSILGQLNVTSIKQLTPREKMLYEMLRSTLRKLYKARRRISYYQKQLAELQG